MLWELFYYMYHVHVSVECHPTIFFLLLSSSELQYTVMYMYMYLPCLNHTICLLYIYVTLPSTQIGMTIHARILTVNVEKFSVDLTSRSSDLKDTEGKFRSDFFLPQLLKLKPAQFVCSVYILYIYITFFFPVFQRMCILTSRQQMLTRRKRKQFKSSPSNVILSIHVYNYSIYMYILVHVDKHILNCTYM